MLSHLSLTQQVIAEPADDAMALIQSMSDAMHEKNYSGEFIYLHGSQIESMSIKHIKTQTGVKELLFSLNDEKREIYRDDENLTCVWPSAKKVIRDPVKKGPHSPLWMPDDVKRLAKFYQFEIIGVGRIADRHSNVVSIKPLDDLRYGMTIWVDSKDNYLLKSLLINEENKILEQVMFTQIRPILNSQSMLLTLMPKAPENYSLIESHSGQVDEQLTPDTSWKMDVLPVGFWRENFYKKASKVKGEFFHHMVFTDGLTSASLFIEEQTNESLIGSSSMGAINAYGVIINNFSVTAVGEVPLKTVKKLVSSVYYE